MVVYHRRPGGQSQFSALIEMDRPDGRFAKLIGWMRSHLSEPLTVDRLADQAAMSPRHFSRAFTTETDLTPAKAVERLRVEAARAHVGSSSDPIDHIGDAVGFTDPERMRAHLSERSDNLLRPSGGRRRVRTQLVTDAVRHNLSQLTNRWPAPAWRILQRPGCEIVHTTGHQRFNAGALVGPFRLSSRSVAIHLEELSDLDRTASAKMWAGFGHLDSGVDVVGRDEAQSDDWIGPAIVADRTAGVDGSGGGHRIVIAFECIPELIHPVQPGSHQFSILGLGLWDAAAMIGE